MRPNANLWKYSTFCFKELSFAEQKLYTGGVISVAVMKEECSRKDERGKGSGRAWGLLGTLSSGQHRLHTGTVSRSKRTKGRSEPECRKSSEHQTKDADSSGSNGETGLRGQDWVSVKNRELRVRRRPGGTGRMGRHAGGLGRQTRLCSSWVAQAQMLTMSLSGVLYVLNISR